MSLSPRADSMVRCWPFLLVEVCRAGRGRAAFVGGWGLLGHVVSAGWRGRAGEAMQSRGGSMKHRIDPKVDCVFKALLGSEENRNLLIHFLNAILAGELSSPITTVELLNPYSDREFLDDKLSGHWSSLIRFVTC